MLDGRVLGASQVEYKPFGKPPLKREAPGSESCRCEVVRGAQPGVPGPALGGLGARDFFEAAEGEAEPARRRGRRPWPRRTASARCRLRADGGHLRAGPRGAGKAGFAGSVQTLQALCSDCHSEKTLRESAQPTSLESRVAPGVVEYARSPKLPPLVFEAQACHKDALYVVDVVRCRRNGLVFA